MTHINHGSTSLALFNQPQENEMNKPWIHADLLEFVANLSDVNCSATISDGVMTLEDGTQIDLYSLVDQPQETEYDV